MRTPKRPLRPHSPSPTPAVPRSVAPRDERSAPTAESADEVTTPSAHTPDAPPAHETVFVQRQAKLASLSDRLAEKQLEARRIRLKRAAVTGAALLVVAAVVWLFLFSPVFALKHQEVKVQGLNSSTALTAEQVQEIAASLDGTSRFLLWRTSLQGDLVALPEVKSAEIRVGLFDGVTVDLVPEVALACVRASTNCVPLNSKGEQMTAPKAVLQKLPQITSLPKVSVDKLAKDQVAAKQEAQVQQLRYRKAAVTLLGTVGDPLAAQVKELSVSDSGQLTLILRGGQTVLWGTLRDTAAKAQILQALLPEKHTYYDVSEPTAPIAK